MPRILLTGISTLDIINTVDGYPAEDSEVRACEQAIRTGGNACNSAKVLQQLGISASLLANTADDLSADFIFGELKQQKINTSLCSVESHSATPTSYITVNKHNGSRTIVHHRQLNELSADYFNELTLDAFDWLHFEARNCDQLKLMLKHAVKFRKTISIEVEKPREHLDDILIFADVLLLSRPYAESQGFKTPAECLEHFSEKYSNTIITCTWGDQGAWAYDTIEITHQPAYKIVKAIETLGAGDTFNAGFIASQIKKRSVKDSLAFACQLAANKCQQTDFTNLIIPSQN
jgi:ketohexokinase